MHNMRENDSHSLGQIPQSPENQLYFPRKDQILQYIQLPELKENEYQLMPLPPLQSVLTQGHELIQPTGVTASLDGHFSDPYGRDTYYTILGLVSSLQDFQGFGDIHSGQGSFPDIHVLTAAARSYLQYMALEDDVERGIYAGELPHEVAVRRTQLPDFLPVDKTGKRAFVSVDATGLALLSLDQILRMNRSDETLQELLPAIKLMTQWAINNVDRHHGMIGYTGYKPSENPEEKIGAIDHTFQDGKYSLLTWDGKIPPHPMKTVYEQGLYFAALNYTADLLMNTDGNYQDHELAARARDAALRIQDNFNRQFVSYDAEGHVRIARAIDGNGKRIESTNIDTLNVLGLTYNGSTILTPEHEQHIPEIVRNLVVKLYTPYGGLRNQGLDSPAREGFVYHGASSLWPFANGMVVRTLAAELCPIIAQDNPLAAQEVYRYAIAIAQSTAGMLLAFDSPVETAHLSEDNRLSLYREVRSNQDVFESSKIQAWTVGWGEWIYRFLTANKITHVPVPSSAVANSSTLL